jgi:hypothetical protein
MAEAARAEKVVFVLMLTARRLTSGDVAARRRAPASLGKRVSDDELDGVRN